MFDADYIGRFNLKWKINSQTGCWDWTASLAGKGYGQVKLPKQRRQDYAHRIAWVIHRGDIPTGKYVLHSCDNPKCVNPDHLFLGNAKVNSQDMKQKGRHLYGERNKRSVLTENDVKKIKQLLEDGMSQQKVANMFGVHQMTVSRIHRGLRWSHIRE